jgi:hypothetical protein
MVLDGKGAADKETSDMSMTPKDLTNPSTVFKKVLGLIELGLGAAAGEFVSSGLNAKVPQNISGFGLGDAAAVAIGSTGAALIKQPDLSNVVGGMALAPAVKAGKLIFAKIMEHVPKPAVGDNTATNQSATSSSGSSGVTGLA